MEEASSIVTTLDISEGLKLYDIIKGIPVEEKPLKTDLDRAMKYNELKTLLLYCKSGFNQNYL